MFIQEYLSHESGTSILVSGFMMSGLNDAFSQDSLKKEKRKALIYWLGTSASERYTNSN